MLENVGVTGSLARLSHKCLVLTRYLPRPKIRKERNLLQDRVTDGQEKPEVRLGTLAI